LTTSSLAAGDYEIKWSYEWSTDDENKLSRHRVQIDDTTTVHEQHVTPKKDYSNDWYAGVGGFAKVTLTAGSHNIDFDFGNDYNGITSYVRRVRLSIVSV
jgi:hypothetical protein